MSTQSNSQDQLLAQMNTCPHLLNNLTDKYLKYLSTTSHTKNVTSWQQIKQLFIKLNNNQTSIEQCILLFNVARLIICQTIGIQKSGINSNRMYCWINMIYGIKCNIVIEVIQSVVQQLTISEQSQKDKEIQKNQFLKYACYGLLLGEIMINTVEKTNKADTSNRVIYPQLYRLINLILMYLSQYQQPGIHFSDNDNKKNMNQQQQINTIKLTKIIQILHQKQNKKQHKKQKKINNKKQHSMNQKIIPKLIIKTIQLLNRSFSLCKFKQISKIYIINNLINQHIKKLLSNFQQQSNQQIKIISSQQSKQNLHQIIQDYLNNFNLFSSNVEQLDQQNKIIKVRQLTPRIVDQLPSMKLKKLRVKKKKLIKKIQTYGKNYNFNRIQQRKVIQDVKNQKIINKQKKDTFILQKQMQQAKKQSRKVKKIKQIQKSKKVQKQHKSHKINK